MTKVNNETYDKFLAALQIITNSYPNFKNNMLKALEEKKNLSTLAYPYQELLLNIIFIHNLLNKEENKKLRLFYENEEYNYKKRIETLKEINNWKTNFTNTFTETNAMICMIELDELNLDEIIEEEENRVTIKNETENDIQDYNKAEKICVNAQKTNLALIGSILIGGAVAIITVGGIVIGSLLIAGSFGTLTPIVSPLMTAETGIGISSILSIIAGVSTLLVGSSTNVSVGIGLCKYFSKKEVKKEEITKIKEIESEEIKKLKQKVFKDEEEIKEEIFEIDIQKLKDEKKEKLDKLKNQTQLLKESEKKVNEAWKKEEKKINELYKKFQKNSEK